MCVAGLNGVYKLFFMGPQGEIFHTLFNCSLQLVTTQGKCSVFGQLCSEMVTAESFKLQHIKQNKDGS